MCSLIWTHTWAQSASANTQSGQLTSNYWESFLWLPSSWGKRRQVLHPYKKKVADYINDTETQCSTIWHMPRSSITGNIQKSNSNVWRNLAVFFSKWSCEFPAYSTCSQQANQCPPYCLVQSIRIFLSECYSLWFTTSPHPHSDYSFINSINKMGKSTKTIKSFQTADIAYADFKKKNPHNLVCHWLNTWQTALCWFYIHKQYMLS